MLGMPANTNTLPIRKPGALLTGLSTSSEPRGTRAIFKRASLSGRPPRFKRSTASGSSTSSTPNASATHSAVMSSCVGPMPPVVNT